MSLRNRTVKVQRRAAGSYVDGLWVAGAPSTFDVKCSVQPLRGQEGAREMMLLPEGRRDKAAFRIYSSVELKPADETTKTNADLVDVNGGTNYEFEVLNNKAWQNNIINHHMAIVVKLEKNSA